MQVRVGTIARLAECLTPVQIRVHIKEDILWEGLARDISKSGNASKEIKWFKVRGTTIILYV